MCCRFDDCVDYYRAFGMPELQARIIEVLRNLDAASNTVVKVTAVPIEETLVCLLVYVVYAVVYVVYVDMCAAGEGNSG